MPEPATLPEITARLHQLDRREWIRLAISLTIIVLLTAAYGQMTLARFQDLLQHSEVATQLRALWGVILLFSVFSIYQQWQTVRLRREVASQMAVAATLELVKPPTPETKQGWSITREHPRYRLNRRVTISATGKGPAHTVHGHTTDVSEGGFAAVLPDPIDPGTSVMIEIQMDGELGTLTIPAIVRHRRGYYHGLEMVDVTPTVKERLRKACEGAEVLKVRSPIDPSVPAEAKVLTSTSAPQRTQP